MLIDGSSEASKTRKTRKIIQITYLKIKSQSANVGVAWADLVGTR